MSIFETDFGVATEQIQVVPSFPIHRQTSLYRCLVVSASQLRREQLSEAASDGGWETVVCDDAENALTDFLHSKFQLVFIDLDGFGATPQEDFRELCEQVVVHADNALLVVCGHEGDALEEIWARQLGIWLYLSGVADQCEGITELCDEARGVVEHLEKAEKRMDTATT